MDEVIYGLIATQYLEELRSGQENSWNCIKLSMYINETYGDYVLSCQGNYQNTDHDDLYNDLEWPGTVLNPFELFLKAPAKAIEVSPFECRLYVARAKFNRLIGDLESEERDL